MRGICRDCGKPVIFARTEAMAWQPLNPEPDEHGNVHAYEVGPGNWLARSVKPGTPAVPPDFLMMPHAATCAGKKAAPAPGRSLPPGVASLAEWRRRRSEVRAGAR